MTATRPADIRLRDVTLRNRIVMSPMCQYVAEEGLASDWHLVHLGSRAAGGAGLVMVEATAVTAEGRISPGDMGIWSDAHVEPLARIARFVRSQGAVPAIQIAHAGRKASCEAPWLGGRQLSLEEGGWTTIAPSAVPFNETDRTPEELDEAGIEQIKLAFELAAERSLAAGFEVIDRKGIPAALVKEGGFDRDAWNKVGAEAVIKNATVGAQIKFQLYDLAKGSNTLAIVRAAYQDPKPADWLSSRTGVPAVTLPFTVGGDAQSKDLFGLFDSTIGKLVALTK